VDILIFGLHQECKGIWWLSSKLAAIICGPAYDCIQFRWSLLSSCKRRSNWFVFRSELRIRLSLLHVN